MSTANSNGNGRGVPAAACIRQSSSKQDASPEQQRAEIGKLASRGGFHIVCEYHDSGISGDRIDKRDAFRRMIADAAKGRFAAILAWDMDRFSRADSIENAYYVHQLRQAGVKLVTVAQGAIDWESFAGRLVYTVNQEAKHSYLVDLSRNMLRGRLASARRGEWLSPPPLGYRVENKRLVVDPTTVAIVRGMFRDYLNGLSLRAIAVGLNAKGITTRRGAAWDGGNVKTILTNRAYLGEFRWGDDQTGKYHHAEELVVIPNNHLALIDRVTFDQVQRRLAKRRTATTPHQGGGGFVFTGMCRCGKCQSPMYGHADVGSIRFRCHGGVENGTCDLNAVGQAELLDHVLTAIEEHLGDPKTLERLRGILTTKTKQRAATVDVAGLTRQLTKVDKQLATARRNMALADGDDMVREFMSVVRELRLQREHLKAAIQNARKPPGRDQAEADQRINRAIKTLQGLRAATLAAPVPKQRELLALVIAKVEVWSRRDGGRGSKYHLERGVVHLRPDFWLTEVETDNLCSTTRSTR